MSFALIVLTIIKGQFEFDTFHRDKSRIYRITSEITDRENKLSGFATTPCPLARDLVTLSPIIEAATFVRPIDYIKTTYNFKSLDLKAAFTDTSFFNIFSFPVYPANSKSSFKETNAVMISDSASKKLFGGEEPLGAVIHLEGLGDFQIVGLIKNGNLKSHLQNDLYVSSGAIPLLERNNKIDSLSNNWKNYLSNITYIKVKNGISQSKLTALLASVSNRLNSIFKVGDGEKSIRFSSQKLSKITPLRGYYMDNASGLTIGIIYIISGAILFLMILTCFNYSNLTVARALTRAREIGVRKVLGASKRQIVGQFIVESFTVAFLSMLLACALITFIPLTDNLSKLFHQATFDWQTAMLVFFFLIFVSLTAGILPALLMSGIRVVEVLKNLSNLKIMNLRFLNKILTIAQFAISGALVLTLITIYRQSRFMEMGDYGFHPENMINVRRDPGSGYSFNTLSSELRQIRGVENVSGSSSLFGYHPTGYCRVLKTNDNASIEAGYFFIDENTILNFGLQLVSGENFWENSPSSQNERVIINEKAVEIFNLKTPQNAIAKTIRADENLRFKVIGVVRDFHFENFKNPIGPLILRYDQSKIQIVNLKIQPFAFNRVYAQIKSKWKQLDIQDPPEIERMNERFRQEQSHEKDVLFFGYFSVMIMAVSSLGLMGISYYAMQVKTREASIRKILGADAFSIMLFLAKEFFVLIGIAMLIGIPAGQYLSWLFLNNFAYKVSLSAGSVIFAVLFILLTCLLTLSAQTIKTAFASPVKRL
jgi:putative ABC transport system permease protein